MEREEATEASTGAEDLELSSGIRLLVLNLPEDEGEGLGFRLTRTLWDPYPWIQEVTAASRADAAGLKAGDCLLQADGKDLLGLPVGQVAGLIRGDGAGRGVSLLVWNCGVDPKDDPELLWSCGGGSRGERARRALAGAVRALACVVCAATATAPLCCARSHLYCGACWARLERCALCREPLPPKECPYARNLVAEQVFEAIATEYEIKNIKKRPTDTSSAHASPNRSPNMSPTVHRRGQYQLSLMNRKKVQFNDKYKQTHASDPNLHRSSIPNKCSCQNRSMVEINRDIVGINRMVEKNGSTDNGIVVTEDKNVQTQDGGGVPVIKVEGDSLTAPHKLVARLRPACSLADLQNNVIQTCQLSRSLNNLDCGAHVHHGSLQDIQCSNKCDPPVFLLTAPPIYVLSCDHSKKE